MNLKCLICDRKLEKNKDRLLCHKMHFSIKLDMSYYDYDQIIDNIIYLIEGNKYGNITTIRAYNKIILQVPFQSFSNQQELENLLPRLLKLKAFG